MEILKNISEMMQKGKVKDVKELVQQALDQKIPAKQILEEGLLSAMNTVGIKFKNNEVFVPEVLIAARAMNAAMEILKPHLKAAGVKPLGKAIVCTVKGDLHDIGKNLVAMMMENSGFCVIDLGTDVAPEDFCQAVIENNADIIGMSALLTTTMPSMQETVQAAIAAGLRDKVKIIIGGAPVTEEYARQIGADGYSEDAVRAVELCKKLLNI